MEIEQEHCKDMDQEKFHRVDGAHAKQVLSALFCSLSILRQNSTHEGTCKDKVHEETAEIHLSKQ